MKRPAVPKPSTQWGHNPIDAFLVAKMESAGLTPSSPADPAQLIRRAYYDLTGLPPSPEAVAAFVADPSANAWKQVIDELLDSPHYG